MDKDRRAFYEYHSCMQEPWDGPALLAFSDGRFAGKRLFPHHQRTPLLGQMITISPSPLPAL